MRAFNVPEVYGIEKGVSVSGRALEGYSPNII